MKIITVMYREETSVRLAAYQYAKPAIEVKIELGPNDTPEVAYQTAKFETRRLLKEAAEEVKERGCYV